MNHVVDDHRRGDAAGAQTTGRDEREISVGGRLPGLDPVLLAHDLEKPISPLDVTGGAGADDTCVSAGRPKAEQVVESGDAIDLAQRQLEPTSDVMQQIQLQIAEQLLRGVQDLDQSALLILLTPHGRLEHDEALIAAGMGRGGGTGRCRGDSGHDCFAGTSSGAG